MPAKPLPPVTIVCDSREQTPWAFNVPGLEKVCAPIVTVRRALRAGDYSIEGLEQRVAIERKEFGDLLSTLTHGRERFERELAILATYDRACIIVEESVETVINGHYRNQVPVASLLGSFASFFARYNVPTVFAGSRRNAQILAATWLCKCAKHLGAPPAPPIDSTAPTEAA